MPAAVTTRPLTPPPAEPALDGPTGRHRRQPTARYRVGRMLDVVGRLGSLVMLAALMVLAATAGGLADGMPATEDAAVTVTFDGSGSP
jgi:hypothetical protein